MLRAENLSRQYFRKTGTANFFYAVKPLNLELLPGQVTVLIKVAPNGSVVEAKVDESVSSADKCLKEFAVRAARLSKFSAKADAPARQQGNIVYEFVAQY